MLFSYHLLYFCTALSLIIMLSSHYHHHKSKTFSQLTQCPFTGTLLLFIRGLRIPSRFIPCKTHSREMAQLQDLILRLESKRAFDCKMLDVANRVACLNGENGPGGTPSHEAPSVSSQGALEISSVTGQPPSLDRSHCSTLRPVAKSLKSDESCRPSSQRPQYPTLYRCLNEGWGPHSSSTGSVVRPGKRLHINMLELKAVSLALRSFKDQCQKNSGSRNGQLNSGSLLKQGGTPSAELGALLWKIMTWCHHYHITLKASVTGSE